MCNEFARHIAPDQIHDSFKQLRIPLDFPEGLPNFAPLDSIRITDVTAIVRAAGTGMEAAELVQRRWSWPGPGGKPVYNYRGEGRAFHNSPTGGRCLIPIDGFYEFTEPAADVEAGKPKRRKKDKWLFTLEPGGPMGGDFFCIAGLWRRDAAVGEAFTLLTCEPGPDIAPYHSRQIVLMPQADWDAWLSGAARATDLIRPAPAGTLRVAPVLA
jgi:putative SOS response-associated peptidase YedK